MDFSVIVIMLTIIIVIGYILSRPFIRSNSAPGTPLETKKLPNQGDDASIKIEAPEHPNSIDTHPGDDTPSK